MFSRESAYATSASGDGIDAAVSSLNRRLATELRSHIRSLALHEPFSPHWMEVQTDVHCIASFAVSEHSAAATHQPPPASQSSPGSPDPSHPNTAAANGSSSQRQVGIDARILFRGKSSGSSPQSAVKQSLWDSQEISVRYLLEEGKVNLLLRLLVDYAAYASTEEALRQVASNPTVFEPLGRRYEHDLCALMEVVLRSVEGCQTIDLTLLVEYAAHMFFSVLQPYYAVVYKLAPAQQQSHGATSVSMRYDWMARNDDSPATYSLLFLMHLVSNMELMTSYESRVLQLFEQYAILRGCVDMALFDEPKRVFSIHTLEAIASVAAFIIGSENYKSNEASYWGLKKSDPSSAEGSSTNASSTASSGSASALKDVKSLYPRLPNDVNMHIMESLKALQNALIARLGTLDAEKKKKWRPLLDAILKAKFWKLKK
eukprot:ANDGO_07067.mRNA.1 hypothetical protein H310_09516